MGGGGNERRGKGDEEGRERKGRIFILKGVLTFPSWLGHR